MTRFDLTFKGTILPDHDPQAVKNGFAELFTIKDPFVLEQLFSGDTFVVRSNLDRKSAADYFRKVVELGGQAELVTSSLVERADIEASDHEAPTVSASGQAVGSGNKSGEVLSHHDGHVDQSWPVSAPRNGGTPGFIPAPESEDPEARKRAAEEERLRMELTELRLERDSAEAAAASELGRLQKEQESTREQYEAEMARIRVMREQTSEKGQGVLDALQLKTTQSSEQFATQTEQLEQELNEKNQASELALEALIETAKSAEKQLLAEATQLEQDRQGTASQAEESVAKLQQLIDETRRQAESDLGELDKLLQANRDALESHKDTYSEQREEIVHQSAEDSDLLQTQLEECQSEKDKLLAELTEEQEQELKKSRESVEQLEEMEGEIELRWSGELELLQQQVVLIQRKLETELESLAAGEASLRQELNETRE